MQFNLAILSLLAFSLPAAIAKPTGAEIVLTASEPEAVTIKTFPNEIGCGWGVSGHYETYPDGECFHLSRDYMDVKKIAETCRVFIYGQEGCTGHEQQHYQGEDCIDIRDYYSIKAFCH